MSTSALSATVGWRESTRFRWTRGYGCRRHNSDPQPQARRRYSVCAGTGAMSAADLLRYDDAQREGIGGRL
jgi:hypothetical protein